MSRIDKHDVNSQDAGAVPGSKDPEDAVSSAQRREALRKLGKYGAYVAPAVLALVLERHASEAAAFSTPPVPSGSGS